MMETSPDCVATSLFDASRAVKALAVPVPENAEGNETRKGIERRAKQIQQPDCLPPVAKTTRRLARPPPAPTMKTRSLPESIMDDGSDDCMMDNPQFTFPSGMSVSATVSRLSVVISLDCERVESKQHNAMRNKNVHQPERIVTGSSSPDGAQMSTARPASKPTRATGTGHTQFVQSKQKKIMQAAMRKFGESKGKPVPAKMSPSLSDRMESMFTIKK